ncbi:MAG TPA: lytic transglycosylase domain-containing protein [Capillimicrobium sp.]|nr:lytic transglycosylase domain-containing protein [Capillimicrobium sp.]
MSAAAIHGRVSEIQQMLVALQTGTLPGAAAAPAPATPATPATSFAAQLSALQAPATATTAAATLGGGDAGQYDALIQSAAQRHGIDPSLLKALIRAESNFDPNAGSPAGAQGLTQLMPGTAAALGVTDVHDPAQAIEGGAKYLRQQLDAFGGDETKALAAYNAGPGAVSRYGGVPPYAETQQYVQRVLGYAAEYRTQSPTPTPTIL